LKPTEVRYDPEADVLYFVFSDKQLEGTLELLPDVYMGITLEGEIVDLEILNPINGAGLKAYFA